MNTIKCSTPECVNVFSTTEDLHPQATYQCRLHTAKAPDKTRFQDSQFAKNLRRASKPIGTTHIKRQGSETDDQLVNRDPEVQDWLQKA